MELNENYKYEIRLEKEKIVLHCVFVSKVNKETIPKPVKRKLEIIKLSKKTQTESVIRLSVSI